jgi:hypothetical protein
MNKEHSLLHMLFTIKPNQKKTPNFPTTTPHFSKGKHKWGKGAKNELQIYLWLISTSCCARHYIYESLNFKGNYVLSG